MKEFPSNSNMNNDDTVVDVKEVTEEPKKVKKVISGTAKKKKKSWTSSIFGEGEDKKMVAETLLWDTFVPAVKDVISDVVSGGIDMLLFGESRGSSRKRSKGLTRPTNYGRPTARNVSPNAPSWRQDARREPLRANKRAIHDFSDIILESRGDAEEVLTHLLELVDMYGEATVADLYDLVGITADHVDINFGWFDLHRANVKRVRGGYLIDLPRTEPLN